MAASRAVCTRSPRPEEFSALSRELFRDTDLLMIQEYMPTDFDWRIVCSMVEPLYACKYYMVSGNWKIYEYENDGSVQSGDSETVPISEVPKAVLEVALNGTRLIGNGFYGVDIKRRRPGHASSRSTTIRALTMASRMRCWGRICIRG